MYLISMCLAMITNGPGGHLKAKKYQLGSSVERFCKALQWLVLFVNLIEVRPVQAAGNRFLCPSAAQQVLQFPQGC